jgi:hypothetical protein
LLQALGFSTKGKTIKEISGDGKNQENAYYGIRA